MIGLRQIDIIGLFVEPAVLCLLAALLATYCIRRVLDRIGINHLVWNRALFDFGLLVGTTALLVLGLHFPET
jgi:protein AaeX